MININSSVSDILIDDQRIHINLMLNYNKKKTILNYFKSSKTKF